MLNWAAEHKLAHRDDPDDRHLFEQADSVLPLYAKRKPGQAELRRAIPAACHGIFHVPAVRAAGMHAGAKHDGSRRHALSARGITHTRLCRRCHEAGQPVPAATKTGLPARRPGCDLRRSAAIAADLQESRHAADDVRERFARRAVALAIKAAREAVERFRAAPLAERQLLLPPRGRGA